MKSIFERVNNPIITAPTDNFFKGKYKFLLILEIYSYRLIRLIVLKKLPRVIEVCKIFKQDTISYFNYLDECIDLPFEVWKKLNIIKEIKVKVWNYVTSKNEIISETRKMYTLFKYK